MKRTRNAVAIVAFGLAAAAAPPGLEAGLTKGPYLQDLGLDEGSAWWATATQGLNTGGSTATSSPASAPSR